MTDQEPIVFDDITPVEVPVKIGGQDYVLREASGDAATRYRNARANCTKFSGGEFAGVDGPIADAQPKLVSDCLFKIVVMPDGKTVFSKVEEKTVRAWPDRIQKALIERVLKISPSLEGTGDETIENLEAKLAKLKETRDSSKNSPSSTTDGSS